MSGAVTTKDGEDTMRDITPFAVRTRGIPGGTGRRGRRVRLIVLAVMAALALPLLTVFVSPASAKGDDRDDYSLYKLSSNASTYFSEKNSPASGDGLSDEWKTVTRSPAAGGSLLGYADPEFSEGNIVGWFFAEVSGSSQTVSYDTFRNLGAEDDDTGAYSGMLDYAHFGAANKDLGLDGMSSSVMGDIMNMLGGSIMWALYALSLFVSLLFYAFIQLLKLLNPFMWFYQAVAGVADAGGSTGSAHQQELAVGMTGGHGGGGGALAGLQTWIADWYGLIVEISWQALVPLFIGFLLIGLVLFKKMDRGSAIKKLIVRIVFIGVGLPLLGSMYTGVLDKFDDSLLGQHAGPTRVVLSTYVDFEAWMMNERLAVPEQATIGWDNGQASSDAMMSVRTSALAINKQAHGSTFADVNIGTKAESAEDAWSDGLVGMDNTASDDAGSVFGVFKLLGSHITSQEIAASDFESGIKTSITQLDVDSKTKQDWFVNDKSYGDPKKFGEEGDPTPHEHPVIAVGNLDSGTGLTSSNPGGAVTRFSTTGTQSGCGFAVQDADGNNVPCNLSPLAAYNYLNTGFGADSLTMYSSNNATSGFTRENHMVVSQVGTGPAKFMYWSNAATVLGCIVLLGFWYAFGMLFGAIKRTFSLVAAIPFATLGAIAAISKVIVYSAALVLEVLVTLFIYQFVSELLITIPDIIAGPMSLLMTENGVFGSAMLGGIAVVVMTLISTILILVVTFALLRVRKVVLQAMDEVFTKLVDKFLDTNTAPKPDKGGMMPALAGGLGAGAGMAAGQKMASALGNPSGGGGARNSPAASNKPGTVSPSTNAGGTNGPKALSAGTGALALGGGKHGGGPDGPDGSPNAGGGDRGLPPGGGSDTDTVRALPSRSGLESASGAKSAAGEPDKGGPLQLAGGKPGSSSAAKETAESLCGQGGLSNLGYSKGQNTNSAGTGARGPVSGGEVIPGELVGTKQKFGGAGAGSSQTASPSPTGQGTQGGRTPANRAGSVGAGQTEFGTGGGSTAKGANPAGQADTHGVSRTGDGRKAVAGQANPTRFGQGSQGSHPNQPAPAGGARFTAGPTGPATAATSGGQPGQAPTRATRPEQAQQAARSGPGSAQTSPASTAPRFMAGTTGAATAITSGQQGQPGTAPMRSTPAAQGQRPQRQQTSSRPAQSTGGGQAEAARPRATAQALVQRAAPVQQPQAVRPVSQPQARPAAQPGKGARSIPRGPTGAVRVSAKPRRMSEDVPVPKSEPRTPKR